MADIEEPETRANPKLAWTIKGLPTERREAIIQAAHRNQESVAEFVWAACERHIQANRGLPAVVPSGLPAVIEGANQGMQSMNLTDLFATVCQLAGTTATKGNGALLAEARKVLRLRLQAVAAGEERAGHKAIAP